MTDWLGLSLEESRDEGRSPFNGLPVLLALPGGIREAFWLKREYCNTLAATLPLNSSIVSPGEIKHRSIARAKGGSSISFGCLADPGAKQGLARSRFLRGAPGVAHAG